VNAELLLLQRHTQALTSNKWRAVFPAWLRYKAVAAAAGFFGQIHGGIGTARQGFQILAILRIRARPMEADTFRS
jgi:hypothetical protein